MIGSKSFQIMGVLNITPDSFFDGGKYYNNVDTAVAHAVAMVKDGATILDIGGESTRPGSEPVSAQVELDRVLPVIEKLEQEIDPAVYLSVDTNKVEIIAEALKHRVQIINTLGGFPKGGKVEKLLATAGRKAQFVAYHIKGEPRTMQKGEIAYPDGVVNTVLDFFATQLALAKEAGIEKQLILDPGIGFGKTLEQNLELIARFAEFKSFKLPLMLGVSRKSHLGMLLQQELQLDYLPGTAERLEAGLAETAVAISNGANIIRTHDVKETVRFCTAYRRVSKM